MMMLIMMISFYSKIIIFYTEWTIPISLNLFPIQYVQEIS